VHTNRAPLFLVDLLSAGSPFGGVICVRTVVPFRCVRTGSLFLHGSGGIAYEFAGHVTFFFSWASPCFEVGWVHYGWKPQFFGPRVSLADLGAAQ